MSFKLASGVCVPNMENIHPCYELHTENGHSAFTINIGIDVLEQLIKQFIDALEDPCFFILEIPTEDSIEKELRTQPTDPFHSDVYYWDGCTRALLAKLFRQYANLLLNDGLCCFGFASHTNHDEIMISTYKVTYIYTVDAPRYEKMLAGLSLPCEEQIRTVWKNFTREQPGTTSKITIDGHDCYDIVKALEPYGLHFAERRES